MKVSEILHTKSLPHSTSARLDLELLLSKILDKPREFLYAYPDYELSTLQEQDFTFLYQRRLQGEPLAYILGKREFWSLDLAIDAGVLIPRPETELLVEIVLSKCQQSKLSVVDLGTGSGAIALALASERPTWEIIATDISEDALQVAKNNAKRLNIENVKFYLGDWCSALPEIDNFDVIISNPPYIAENDPHLKQGDVGFEPKLALVAGNGLVAIAAIIKQAKSKLKSGGYLVLEHGYDQGKPVQELLHKNGYRDILPFKDFAGIDRAVLARQV